ncbi:MAG TPA: hypothetical protein VK638_59050 [Edaphobacter sp.]|nr:hypothetical protein [Edaphobacter sp.]
MPWVPRATLNRIESLLNQVLTAQRFNDKTLLEIKSMATNAVTQAQFTNDLNALQAALTIMVSNVQADIAALKAAVAAGQPADFSALDATVQAMSTAVSAENTAALADLTPPAPPAA